MNIKPLFDRVIVKQIEEEKKTSGLVISQVPSDTILLAKVLSVGDGLEKDDNKKTQMVVKSGDTVLCNKFAVTKFKHENEELYILKQTDILAVLTKGE